MADGGEHGQVKAIAALFEHWCFALWGVAFAGGMLRAKSQFIQEDNQPALPLCFGSDAGIGLLKPSLHLMCVLLVSPERRLLEGKTPVLQQLSCVAYAVVYGGFFLISRRTAAAVHK